MGFFEIINKFDISALDALRGALRCDFLDWLMPLVTLLGEAGIFWIAVALVMLCLRPTRECGMMLAVAMILGLLLCNCILKPLIDRPRPFEVDTAVTLLVGAPGDGSFPSGHTAVCFEAATVLLYGLRRKIFGGAALAAAFSVAFSRLYLYLHYPSDVIAGAVLGVLCAVTAIFIWKRILRKKIGGRLGDEIPPDKHF